MLVRTFENWGHNPNSKKILQIIGPKLSCQLWDKFDKLHGKGGYFKVRSMAVLSFCTHANSLAFLHRWPIALQKCFPQPIVTKNSVKENTKKPSVRRRTHHKWKTHASSLLTPILATPALQTQTTPEIIRAALEQDAGVFHCIERWSRLQCCWCAAQRKQLAAQQKRQTIKKKVS